MKSEQFYLCKLVDRLQNRLSRGEKKVLSKEIMADFSNHSPLKNKLMAPFSQQPSFSFRLGKRKMVTGNEWADLVKSGLKLLLFKYFTFYYSKSIYLCIFFDGESFHLGSWYATAVLVKLQVDFKSYLYGNLNF